MLGDLSEGLVELGGVFQDRLVLLSPRLEEEEVVKAGPHLNL